MAGVWSVQMGLHGPAWGIPQERITGFQNRLAGIKPLFAEVKSAGRNSVNTEQRRILFRELELDMQFIKANYFNPPPRTPDELIALLQSVHGGSWTPILPFGLADLRLELFVTVCWQTPRNQDGPYCPIVSRIIA
jgi:hypothetical protein